LGVMFFNFAVDEMDTVYSFREYDMIGNFSSLVDRFNGEITLDDMKDGFLAEAENYGINEQKALFLLEGGETANTKLLNYGKG
jgi:hypothetical protein